MSSALWAKWGSGGDRWYPLQAHLLDTAAFASVLCRDWMPERLMVRIGKLLGTDVAGFELSVVSAAALHDLGKADPVFQGQLLSSRHREFASCLDTLAGDGLKVSPPAWPGRNATAEEKRYLSRHEIASAVLLAGGFDGAEMTGLSTVVAGHHGRWSIPDWQAPPYVCRYYEWLRHDPGWSACHRGLVGLLVDVAGIDPDVTISDAAVVPLLTGLVCLADWLASDLADRVDAPDPTTTDWQAYHRQRIVAGRDRVEDLLGTAAKPQAPFAALFSFEPDRPVQKGLVRKGQAGLRIVAVPTGEGKTEAALGHWLLNACPHQGLFFALPTMATADAMFNRVRAMFTDGGTSTLGTLAHGRAMLNEFYDLPDDELGGEFHGDTGQGGLHPGMWFRGRHRALLAPVTVGTADQVLLGVLRHHFNFLRLLGAAAKTVVFDEVHSYDPYMARLLEQFLRWAGEFGIDVVLLSATLPAQQLRAYVAAYGGDTLGLEAAYPGVVTVRDGSTIQSALPASQRHTSLRLVHHRVADRAVGAAALALQLHRAHPDAKVGVIVNTVGRCQAVASMLIDHGLPVEVMHSRFPAAIRAEQIHSALTRYGKHSTTGGAVLVATQVAEQSVDLDFDALVTDLCPAASLVQRAGRLHRHVHEPRRRIRPAGLEQPAIHLIVPDPVPTTLWPHLPYPVALILRTWEHGLRSGGTTVLRVPDDVQEFIDVSHVTFETMDQRHQETVDRHLLDTAVTIDQARQRAVPTPAELRREPARCLTEFAAGDLDEGHFETRWFNDQRLDVLLVGGAPGAWNGPLPAEPALEQIRKLLGCVVTLTGAAAGRVTPACDPGSDRPKGWDRGLLARVSVLDLDANPQHRLDPVLGFMTTQEHP